ncbi:unnamed protein product [Rotaria sp. Silwood2]|nr:unnamed protein product [Rotaria sp. Silwood2]CAF4408919.1 unnamed protein product [Rotaria sp. Silwood2]
MRIAPLALAFRDASDEQLYEAVRMAIISSHVHPEGIDGAFILAKAIILALHCESVDVFDSSEYLNILQKTARTNDMQTQLTKLIALYNKQYGTTGANRTKRTDYEVVRYFGSSFQIKAIEAIPCALWIVCTSYREPEECLVRNVNMGGDTDTVAAIIGDIVGALHGWQWIPSRWYDNIGPNSDENLGRGKDYAVDLAKKLAEINLNHILDDDD